MRPKQPASIQISLSGDFSARTLVSGPKLSHGRQKSSGGQKHCSNISNVSPFPNEMYVLVLTMLPDIVSEYV